MTAAEPPASQAVQSAETGGGDEPSAKPFWGQKWGDGQEKNQIHFEKTAKVMRDIFEAMQGFHKELGTRYSFLDIGCAPGGFSRFMCSDPRCERGFGISLPVTEGGFKLLFTWSSPDERKFSVKFRDMLTLEPEQCCDQPVQIVLSDAQYLVLRKADQPGPDPALAKPQAINPSLGIWSLLFQQLRLGLSNLQNGGIMMFRMNCKDDNIDWYYEAVCQVFAFVNHLFESMVLFKSGKSHQSDGTAYVLCRGFCKCEFEAMGGAELLRKSIMVSKYEQDVVSLSQAPIFKKLTPSREVRARTRECFRLVTDAISRYKAQVDFDYNATVREWRCSRSLPFLKRTARASIGATLPMVAGRVAATELERAADELGEVAEELRPGKALNLEDLQTRLAERCRQAEESLRARAEEVKRILKAAQEDWSAHTEHDDTGLIEGEGSQPAAEQPEPAPSEFLHVTGLMQGIEEAVLQKCLAAVGKVAELRFLPQESTSSCAVLVRMQSQEEAVLARERLDGVNPESYGGAAKKNLSSMQITFQIKNGIQVCDHLYVRGIPPVVQQHQLASLFSKYGSVLWSRIMAPRDDVSYSEGRSALVQMGSSDQAQAAMQALNYGSATQLMAPMKVRFASEGLYKQQEEEDEEEDEEGEEEEDFSLFSVIEEAPKPSLQPQKQRPAESGSRWKNLEDPNAGKGPEGARLWGWTPQPVDEAEEFPELTPAAPEPDAALESWEELGKDVPCETLCMKDAPPGLPDSVMLMWFKPYGHVVDMQPYEPASSPGQQAFLVQMSCVEEAINAVNALHGKSIARGKPLVLEYWHGEQEEESQAHQDCSHQVCSSCGTGLQAAWKFCPECGFAAKKKKAASQSSADGGGKESPQSAAEDSKTSGINAAALLAACRASNAKRKAEPPTEVEPAPETQASEILPSADAEVVPGAETGIGDVALLEACREALAKRREPLLPREAETTPGMEETPSDGDAEDWEALANDNDEPEDGAAEPEAWEESDCICMTGAPPGLPETVMQFWFKPFGSVLQLRALTAQESGQSGPAFLVQMGSQDEAIAAVAALNNKAIMKGKSLVLEYWHGKP